MKDVNQQVLGDFYKALLKAKDKPQIYYKVDALDLYIVVVVKDEVSLLEERIYEAEWKVLDKYPNIAISVRVVPKFGFPFYKVVPEGFNKYII